MDFCGIVNEIIGRHWWRLVIFPDFILRVVQAMIRWCRCYRVSLTTRTEWTNRGLAVQPSVLAEEAWWLIFYNAGTLAFSTRIARPRLARAPVTRSAEFALDLEASATRRIKALWHASSVVIIRQPHEIHGHVLSACPHCRYSAHCAMLDEPSSWQDTIKC
jgi:hypothetical protein